MQIRAVYPKKRSSSPFASELGDEGASAELPEALDAVSPTRRCLRNEAHSFRVVVGLETTLIGVDLEVDLEAAERRERGAAADLLAIALRGWTRRLKDPPTMKAIAAPCCLRTGATGTTLFEAFSSPFSRKKRRETRAGNL